MNKRPNILFAIADDASHMSAYGHKFLSTPYFDRVAREGILFTHAFTPNPKCAPSRACILTGMHTWQLEDAGNHFGVFPAKFRVFPDLLEEIGYHVGYTGKGWAPGDWRRGGFTRNPAGVEYNQKKLTPPAQTKIRDIDYAANFEVFLAERDPVAPFCFWYGGFEPHRPYLPGEGMRAGKTLDTVEVPKFLPDDEVVKADLLDYAFEIEWFDLHLGRMLSKLEEIGELDNTLIVVTSDNGMPFPRVKGQMYDQDFRLPMAMCWKDRIKGGRVVDDLISFTDLAPTFLEVAQGEIHPQMVGRSLMDILTSVHAGRIDPSRDRVFLGRERHDLGREGDVGYPVRCLRTEKYLYVLNCKPERWPAGNPETGFTNCDSSPTKSLILEQYAQGHDYYYNLAFGKRPQEELYDITTDPECIHNLAAKPTYQRIKQRLHEDLIAELKATGDPRILGEGDRFDEYEYVGKANHSWKAYVEGWFEKQSY